MKRLDEYLPGIAGVKTQTLHFEEPFAEMAARFVHEPGSVVLLSGGDLDCSRYHILGIRPWLTLAGRFGEARLVIDGVTQIVPLSPLDMLEIVLDRCCLDAGDVTDPIVAGLFGYLAYDLKDALESLPRTVIDDLGLPHLYVVAPSLIVVHDKTSNTTRVHAPIRRGQDIGAVHTTLDEFMQVLGSPPPEPGDVSETGPSMRSNVTRDDYVAAVQRIRDYIAAGDVYQVNFSQRFEMGIEGDSYTLFKTLYQMNPAPFFAFVNAGDHQVVSTSPERFLMRRGRRVETRPIKGTRPRGKTPEQDLEMKAALECSHKDDAELSMIVDLLRNDIGKVCQGGSVAVAQHKRLEAYQNVYHLVSVVEGTLADGSSSVDLIRAAFPGGSITGCPKIRSMEIIDELETHCRHVYTGSIGYISFHGTMDLSIAIRTAIRMGDRLVFSVGGGIVYDSDPLDEHEETLHKGRTLISLFQGTDAASKFESQSKPWVWQNGRLIPQEEATIPVADLGLQYGHGFFETIRVEKGTLCRLNAHLDRFNRTWSALFPGPPPDLTWGEIIGRVIEKNRLSGSTAAVKILATRGDGSTSRPCGTLLVTARAYIPRLAALGVTGLNLATYPHPRTTPLAGHKTLNYLYYHQAGVWAMDQGADEAVVLNPDGTVSETNTTNLLVLSDRRTVIRPRSSFVLPGVMQDAICQRLTRLGLSIVDHEIHPKDLFNADAVLLTNALMGVVPALSLNGRPMNFDQKLIDALSSDLFEPEVVSGHP